MIGWNFPSNNYGRDDGFNDAGIEHFRGNIWESLTREVIQNSLDAKYDKSKKPVEVHFKLEDLPLNKFPDKESFINILKSCFEFWKNNDKVKSFFKETLNLMKLPQIPVLKISDYNTTGVTGADREFGTNWHALIKSEGASDKNSGAGGSYGIGKNAPFACSQIRTIFYGTKDFTGKTAFQGVSKLVTHKNEQGENTQGTGYYGIKSRNLPIYDYSEVDEFFYRDKVGTDVFVMGFKKTRDWKEKIIKSVLENFFVAVYEQKLTVKVEDIIINSKTLPELLEKYINNDSSSAVGKYYSEKYYKTLISHEKHFIEEDFEGLGRVELYILSGKSYPKKVAMVRNTGMKIYDKGHFRTPLKFAGVLIAKGEKLNELLRLMEPPSHNNWEPDRYEKDPAFGREILKKIYKWIDEKIRSISVVDNSEELDIEGISQYLPDDLDDLPIRSEDNKSEGEKSRPKKGNIKKIKHRNTPIITVADPEVAVAAEEDVGEIVSIIKRPEKGPKERPKKSDGGGKPPVKKGPYNGGKTRGSINLRKLRIFCLSPDQGIYNASFEPELSGEGFLKIKAVGEVGRELVPIKSVIDGTSNKKINIRRNGKIGPIKFKAGVKQNLIITLENALRCALEVSASEN
ncbi:MAG: hypothetical protein PWP66_278 [Thermosediminibacterales bacterium]|nr:hypothetical protein [Thermosediminibacterales bacterium]